MNQPKKHTNTRGFTIVELLIVIVVIGILAAITIVSYTGVKDRATDTDLRSVANQVEKAILVWTADTNLTPKSGYSSATAFDGIKCGSGTGGWVWSTSYTCSLSDLLAGNQLIPADLISSAPRNNEYGTRTDGGYSFMIYPCSPPDRYALYYYLNVPTAEDTANLANVEAAGCPTTPRITYKMKAASLIEVNGS